jgi:WXXGXW repeat (2 copies)
MRTVSRIGIASSLVLVAAVAVRVEAQTPLPPKINESPPLDGPATELDPIPAAEPKPKVTTERPVAVQEDRTPTRRVYAPKEPPALIIERPSGTRPGRRALWVPGYWEWDRDQGGYVWVGGSWQIVPVGSVWVGTRWVRDENGWYRVPGYWSRRRDGTVVETQITRTNSPSWRTTGPPADHPIDSPRPAPGPDYFFIPGHYRAVGDRMSWLRGFWAQVQPGWDWIPARWVRRSDGWQFREGHWVRDAATEGGQIGQRTTAPPDGVAQPPEPAEPNPPGVEAGARAGADRLTPPPMPVPDRDDMGDPDEADRVVVEPGDPVVVVRPRTGMPYYVIRPPGAYPYGPGGVVVPGAVPPFVRRLLDRVLP